MMMIKIQVSYILWIILEWDGESYYSSVIHVKESPIIKYKIELVKFKKIIIF